MDELLGCDICSQELARTTAISLSALHPISPIIFLLVFIAQWPKLARDAFVNNVDLNFLLGANLMALVVIAPLLLYVIATLARGVGFVFGGQGTAYGARLALFWALLASTPLILLHGLTAGFVGPGPELKVVGVIWLGVFFWFWISGSIAQERYT